MQYPVIEENPAKDPYSTLLLVNHFRSLLLSE